MTRGVNLTFAVSRRGSHPVFISPCITNLTVLKQECHIGVSLLKYAASNFAHRKLRFF